MGMGDELMALGDARRLMQSDPRRVLIVDRYDNPRWHPLWEGSQRIARPGDRGLCQYFRNGPGVRPYHAGKTERRWHYNLAYRATPAELQLQPDEIEFGERYAGRLIVEPFIKAGASPNKQWGRPRWEQFANLAEHDGLRLAQVGPVGARAMALPGVEFITTDSFRLACAVIARARACVLPEGGLHHAAAAFATPAVVIFGGFTPVDVTGYDMHVNIGASMDDACGMQKPCAHCDKWMRRITPEQVLGELMRILEC